MRSLYTTRAAARRMAIVFVCAFQLTTSLSALDYYWVNGSGAWSQFATHWAKIPNPTLPAHYHANVPTADDDVYFGDTNGGAAYTVNVDAGSTVPKCRNMDWMGVPAGTVWGGGGGRMDIYGSVMLSSVMSMTYFGQIHLISNTATTKTITSNGIHFSCAVYFEGTMGGWQLSDDFYCDLDVNHTGGLLETMGKKVTIVSYFTGNYAIQDGVLHLGSSEVVVLGSFLVRYTPTQFDAGTSHIKMVNANQFLSGYDYLGHDLHFFDVSFLSDCDSGGFAWGSVDGTLTFHGRGRIHGYSNGPVMTLKTVVFLQNGHIYNAVNYKHLTLTAGKTYTVENYCCTNGTDQTILPGGTLTALGAGTCAEFITIKSWQYGTHFNFVNNSGAKQTVHCVILEDCHATGSDLLEVEDGVDLGNNTGWIFTLPNPGLDLYWVGGAGDWNDPNHWSETDGGAPGACLPNGASNVHFTALSGFSPGDQVTVSEDAYCLNMDWTGVTGVPEINSGAVNLHIYDSLTLDADMYFNFGGTVRFRTSDTSTITSASHAFPYIVVFEGSGVWELQDTFKAPVYYVFHKRGTFKTLGHPMLIYNWLGNVREDFSGVFINMGAELWLGEPGGNSSTVFLIKSTQTNEKGHFRCWYEAGKFHAVESHIIGEKGGYIDCHPTTYHDFWNVTFLPIDHAGDFLYGNILNKLTFLAFGNLIGPNSHIHEVEFHKGAYLFDSHTYDILTIHGGHNFKFQPYTGTGSTVQTITAGGTFNHINTSCEYPTVMHNPTPGETTTFRKEGAGTAFDIQHTIFDRVYADQTSGAIYTATNCVAIQPDVEASWNITNPAPRDLYWVGGAGDWHSAAHWSLASGGAGGECPPTAHDDVFFNGASGLGVGDAVTVNQKFAFCKDMDWTGVGSGVVFDNSITSGNTLDFYALNNLSIFGSLKFSSAMTNNFIGSVWFRANGPATITSAGNHFKWYTHFWEPAGDWSLTDALSIDAFAIHYYGKISSNNQMMTVAKWLTQDPSIISASAALYLGSSTLNIVGGGGYNTDANGNFFYDAGQFHCGTSNIIIGDYNLGHNYPGTLFAYGTPHEFYNVTFKGVSAHLHSGIILNKLIFETTGYIQAGGDVHEAEFYEDFYFYGSRNYHSIKFFPGKRYNFLAGNTQNIIPHNGVEGQFIAQGLPGQYIEMKSDNPSVPAIIHKDDYDGTSTCTKYLFLTGMTHTGTEDIYVPTPGGDVFNNTGWQFFPCNPCPATVPVLDVAASITTGCPPGQAKLVLAGLKPDEWAIWYTDPAATSNIVYNGGTPGPAGNMFMPTITGPTTYYARVYSDGGLCESTVVLSVDITITAPPAQFNMTGGGTVCAGSNGAPVGLDGSATGVSYQLQLDGSDTGSPLPGTGSALNFGLQTAAGTYTVVATTDGTACSAVMSGTAVVTNDPSQAPAVAAGSNSPVYSATTDLELTEPGGAAVSWAWSGPNGFASADQNPMINNPTPANSGAYTVVVTGANGCSNAAVVQVLVSPLAIACPNDIVVDLDPGECGAIVNYPLPFVTGGAGGGNVLLTSGLPSGAEFTFGVTTNCFEVTDAQNNSATCCFDVMVNEYVSLGAFVCSDLISVSLDQTCQFVVTADVVLEGGGYGCYNNYIVELDKVTPFGNGPWIQPAEVDAGDIGNTYLIKVTDPVRGIFCAGNLCVQDALPPQMQCSDITVDCGPPPEVPPVVTDCQAYTLTWTDEVMQNAPPTTPFRVITRRWTATDAALNSDVCTQKISIQYPQPVTQNSCVLEQCEDAPGSGQATFDLTDSEPCLTQGVGGLTVQYFTDVGLTMEILMPDAFLSGARTVYTLITNAGTGCAISGTMALDVALPDAGNIAGPVELCSGNGFQYTSSGVAGGLWGSDDPNVATIDANSGLVITGTPGFCTISYTVTENGCTNTSYLYLEVLQTPFVNAISNSPVCAGGDVILEETGGQGVSWAWSGPGGYQSTDQNPVINNATTANSGDYTVMVTDANGCTISWMTAVDVLPSQQVSCPPAQTTCSANLPLDLSALAVSPAGGVFSGVGVNGVLYSAPAGSTNTLMYTYGSGSCSNACLFDITVEASPQPAMCPPDLIRCVFELPLDLTTLPVSPTGGSFSGSGVSGNLFNAPAGATYDITYSAGAGNCTSNCTFAIQVTEKAQIKCPGSVTVCASDCDTFGLGGGLPLGGVYTGPAVVNGAIDFAVYGSGPHIVTYTLNGGTACASSCVYIVRYGN